VSLRMISRMPFILVVMLLIMLFYSLIIEEIQFLFVLFYIVV
jgi:hypothetical protein